ncbi:TetR/AcrR family transcriptional regulator [Actinoplanes sp. TBRC 11911]|uniref:TetR/AcrR family transcriptional regulator n=1 Tax=Actinoplanes sp. TBRC 11911 TaxID=2729386 RepID=UPI00145CF7C1|nr:TetR/AcrR family transcriptional regulator [Actinoplanes sp. TBRC 11911]NMO51299.1 TetR/AcrR family transcriptional regulator [Actinoplanes sp. TBRC 11911]
MTADFFWAPRPKPTRGPKPALTLDEIADAAIAVADAEGLAAVSMQRVAADLGYTKMSLYRYVPGKAELVAAMLERAMSTPPALPHGWRAALTTWAESMLTRLAGHPWALEVMALGGRPVGPTEVAWLESALAALPTGLTGAERMDVVATLAWHVRGTAAEAGTGETEFTASVGRILREHADRYPNVASAFADVASRGGADQAFHFGLNRFFDGVEAYLERV